MKLLTIGSWVVDLGKLAAAFLALSSSEGLAAGVKGLPGLASSVFGGNSPQAIFKSSVSEFAAAVSRFAGSSVIGSAEGAAEGAGESRAARNSLLQSRPGSQLPLQLVARP